MSVPRAVSQLIEIEAARNAGILDPDKTLAIALSRVGGGDENQRIVAGTLQELQDHDEAAFGEPLHSLVIVGKRLHPMEVEYAEAYAINRDNWRTIAHTVYGCALE